MFTTNYRKLYDNNCLNRYRRLTKHMCDDLRQCVVAMIFRKNITTKVVWNGFV